MPLGDLYADDWKSWEFREDVTLLRRRNPSEASEDTFEEYQLTATNGAVKRRAIKYSEVMAGFGDFSNINIVFLLPRQNLPDGTDELVIPARGYFIVDAEDKSYNILEVIGGKWAQTFKCICIDAPVPS